MISVIMAAYNASEFIEQAIESVLNQTYREFELIIIDDGSTDETLKIARRYGEQDPRVRVIQGNHSGVSSARNLGIHESKYPWIAIMDADDIALPERFAKQIQATCDNPKVVAWGTNYYHINSKGETLSYSQCGPTTEAEFYSIRNAGHLAPFCNPTVLLKKEVFLKAGGYNSKISQAEDLDLFDRMSRYGPLLTIPEPLLCYRVHSKSATMQDFFLQKLVIQFLVDRHRDHLADSKNELSFEVFLKREQQKSPLVRFSRYLQNLGMFSYRKSGLFYGEKQYFQAFVYLAFSVLLVPQYSIARVWRQFLSPKARQKKQAMLNSD